MKKIFVLIFGLAFLSGCFLFEGEKTFNSDNVNITLTQEYSDVTSDFKGFELVLESLFCAVFINVEAKSDFTTAYSLDQYTDLVLTQATNTEVKKYNEDDVVFNYSTYEAEAEGVIYKYLIVTKESDDNFMTGNFAVVRSKFDSYYDEFMEFAKSITLE